MHTKGPWIANTHRTVKNGGREFVYIHSPDHIVPIACVPIGVEGYGREEGLANARMIAASPLVVAALQNIANMIDSGIITGDGKHDIETQLRAALGASKGL